MATAKSRALSFTNIRYARRIHFRTAVIVSEERTGTQSTCRNKEKTVRSCTVLTSCHLLEESRSSRRRTAPCSSVFSLRFPRLGAVSAQCRHNVDAARHFEFVRPGSFRSARFVYTRTFINQQIMSVEIAVLDAKTCVRAFVCFLFLA